MRKGIPRELWIYRPDGFQRWQGTRVASIHSVDVVILDYFMPAMNGQEVAMEMRRLRPQAPIILITEGLDVPEQTLNLLDALVAKDRLASQLLPAIAHLRGCGSDPSTFV